MSPYRDDEQALRERLAAQIYVDEKIHQYIAAVIATGPVPDGTSDRILHDARMCADRAGRRYVVPDDAREAARKHYPDSIVDSIAVR